MSRMLSFVVFSKRLTWSNHPDLLLGESRRICKLKKSLYGLKRSTKLWFERFVEVGRQRAQKNHSIFFHSHQRKRILLVIYIDVIVIAGDNDAGIKDLNAYIQQKSPTEGLGQLIYFSSMKVAWPKKGMPLSESKYVLNMLSKVGY